MFWIINALLVLLALVFLLPPLFRKDSRDSDSRSQQNILIATEQLKELELRFEKAEIDEDTYNESRDELELTLFTDVNQVDDSIVDASSSNTSSWGVATIIIIMVPLVSVLFYSKVGSSIFQEHLDPKQAIAEYRDSAVPKNSDGTPDIDTMVIGLEKKLEKDPNNVSGWYMLGRSYMMLRKYPKAVSSYEKALKIKPDAVDVMLALADSLAMINKGQITGRPVALIDKALELEPENVMALWLGGMASKQVGNHLQSIQRWTKVLKYLKDPEEKAEVESLISEAMTKLTPEQKQTLGGSKAVVAPIKTEPTKVVANTNIGITVTVSLADAIKNQLSPTDTVFVYAKMIEGSPMPLAAAKLQVQDLPKEVFLNDAMAVMSNMKLSSQTEVTVGAKISLSGNASTKANDIVSEKRSVKVGSKIELLIQ